MINFAIKTTAGREVLGLALSDEDLETVANEGKVVFDLESVGVGFWRREPDGSRVFMQPRDSQVLIFKAETIEEIGEVIGVELPSKEELQRRKAAAENKQ